MQELTFNQDIIEKSAAYVTANFSEQIKKLYPCNQVSELIKQLPYEELIALAAGEASLTSLTNIWGIPKIKSVYFQIIEKHPQISENYPTLDIFSLPESALERLTRGESIEKVLGIKPVAKETDILSIQPQNPMDPPKRERKGYSPQESGVLRSVIPGRGIRRDYASGNNGNYRGNTGN